TKDSADGTIMTGSFLDKYRDRLVLEDIEARLGGVECKSLNTNSSVATEEIFDVAAASPCVIATNVTVVRAEHGAAFTGALYNVNQRRIRSELGIGKCVGAPEIHIPFAIAVPFGARRHVGYLLHFFSRIFTSAGIGRIGEVTEPRGYWRLGGFGTFATEQPGEGNKHISNRSTRGATEQGRNIKTSVR